MVDNGFTVDIRNVNDMSTVRSQYPVPTQIQGCHTAIVDGYIIEGHVPAAEIRRLLSERPDIVGLAVPGMPVGSPGMEVEGAAAEPYEVVAFDKSGNIELYASYP
jgi:hypothetical protein